jgi:magnesium-transporting ATPase (P-type)
MNNIGWLVLVTGQSVVLYSRLGVILHNPRVLRLVLWMIIVDGIVFYITTTIIHYGTYSSDGSFDTAATIIEKIQMTGFCIQEFIISGLYVLEVWRLSKILIHENSRQTMWELLVINLVIIALDIALLTLEYLGLSVLEQVFKGTAYSYKLKMEFAILGKLVSMAQMHSTAPVFPGSGSPPEHTEHQTGPGPTKSQTAQLSFV